MSEQTMPSHKDLYLYRVPILLVVLALMLWFRGDPVFMGATLLVALVAFLAVREEEDQMRKANEQKHELDEQLIQSQKLASIGELSSGVAHEINNPLAVTGREVEWMHSVLEEAEIKDPKHLEDIKDSLREIEHQVSRCTQITFKLLDFARTRETLVQNADINKLIEDMVNLVEKVSQKNIDFVRNYAKDLPAISTDVPLLRQVILNLLNNAIYAVGEKGSITITTQSPGYDSVNIVVSDTGCGISKEHLARIFDPFFTTKPQGKGTGLGLSICHGIITKLGGNISAQSEVGKGTTFTVQLPVKKAKGPRRK